jgi:hypothetical protein
MSKESTMETKVIGYYTDLKGVRFAASHQHLWKAELMAQVLSKMYKKPTERGQLICSLEVYARLQN